MHNALLISEVLDCIIDYLVQDTVQYPKSSYARDPQKAGRRALVMLARTCRALSEPALNALWRGLHSLEPFVLCLSTRASYDDSAVDGPLHPFNDEEWSTVSRYTPRVQELTLEHALSVKILESLWFRTTLLLPNLRKLYWSYEDYRAIGSIRLLLSPPLVHLQVRIDGGDHSSVLGFLECYQTLCPNLKSLYLYQPCPDPHVTTAISRAILRSPNLETLTCDPIDEVALVHIAESHRLKKLRANLHNFQLDDLKRLASYGTIDRPAFENVRVLELYVQDLSSIIPFLKPHHQPFEEVLCVSRTCPTLEILYEFFTALSSATRRGTLRHIRLQSSNSRKYGMPSRSVDFRVLSPLMTFNLHKLNVDLNCLVSLNDDELAQLVQAWPELETFNLNLHSRWICSPSSQMPTLRGLLFLLARCPKLLNLGMCIDARSIPSLTENESLIRNMAVTRLSLANSPIEEPVARVAQFLLDHFPSLKALQAYPMLVTEPPSLGYRRMWKKVNTQIQEISGCSGSSPESSDSDLDKFMY